MSDSGSVHSDMLVSALGTSEREDSQQMIKRVKKRIQHYFAPVLRAERVSKDERIEVDRAELVERNLVSSLRFDQQKRAAFAEHSLESTKHRLIDLLKAGLSGPSAAALGQGRSALSSVIIQPPPPLTARGLPPQAK